MLFAGWLIGVVVTKYLLPVTKDDEPNDEAKIIQNTPILLAPKNAELCTEKKPRRKWVKPELNYTETDSRVLYPPVMPSVEMASNSSLNSSFSSSVYTRFHLDSDMIAYDSFNSTSDSDDNPAFMMRGVLVEEENFSFNIQRFFNFTNTSIAPFEEINSNFVSSKSSEESARLDSDNDSLIVNLSSDSSLISEDKQDIFGPKHRCVVTNPSPTNQIEAFEQIISNGNASSSSATSDQVARLNSDNDDDEQYIFDPQLKCFVPNPKKNPIVPSQECISICNATSSSSLNQVARVDSDNEGSDNIFSEYIFDPQLKCFVPNPKMNPIPANPIALSQEITSNYNATSGSRSDEFDRDSTKTLTMEDLIGEDAQQYMGFETSCEQISQNPKNGRPPFDESERRYALDKNHL